MTDKLSQDETESLTAPGKLLRDKREKMGLTQEDIATRMRLSKQTIKDIELDDYSHFSAAIYVHGYLRGFAAIVGLNSEPLLRAFNKMGFVEQLNQMPRTSYIASSVTKTVRLNRSKKRIASWMSYFFFALLIALVVAWWHGQRNHKHATINPNMLTAVEQPADVKNTSTLPLTTKYEQAPTHHNDEQKRK
jgi:cytoskeletal protein RodZ